MTRFAGVLVHVLVLMAVSATAQAGEAISFTIGGHRIHIEAPRGCRSASCVSVSIPGLVFKQGRRDRDDGASVTPAAPLPQPAPPVVAPAPAPMPVVPVAVPAPSIVAAPSPPQSLPPPPVTLAAAAPPQVVVPPPPKPEPAKTAAPPVPEALPVAPQLIAHAAKILQGTEDEPGDAPLGDWETEGAKEGAKQGGRGSVRIERCGPALCGYVLDASGKGETVLINMKPKAADAEWSGSIYSRDSGATYYATMALKGSDTLRVEACALGRFFCTGNDWRRVTATDQRMITSRQVTAQPRS